MATNTFNLQTGVVTYTGNDGEQIEVQGKAVDAPINTPSSSEEVSCFLKRHQAGQTDFNTFCLEIVGAGVCKWISDIHALKCSYYDLKESIILAETIPSV